MKKQWTLEKLEDWQSVIEDTEELWEAGVWLWLSGELGAGKTSFVRHLLRSWGYNEPVISPSFSLAVEYPFDDVHVVHFDAFRLKKGEALAWSWREWEDSLVFAEWPENIEAPWERFNFKLRIQRVEGGKKRLVELEML